MSRKARWVAGSIPVRGVAHLLAYWDDGGRPDLLPPHAPSNPTAAMRIGAVIRTCIAARYISFQARVVSPRVAPADGFRAPHLCGSGSYIPFATTRAERETSGTPGSRWRRGTEITAATSKRCVRQPGN